MCEQKLNLEKLDTLLEVQLFQLFLQYFKNYSQ